LPLGIRNDYGVLLGGIGADTYGRDAAAAVETAQSCPPANVSHRRLNAKIGRRTAFRRTLSARIPYKSCR
jgi:hypothetical protein